MNRTVDQELSKKTRITLLALKIHQRKAQQEILNKQYEERLRIEEEYYKKIRKIFSQLEEQVKKEYEECKKKGIPEQNIITLMEVYFKECKERYEKLEDIYIEKTIKLSKEQLERNLEEQVKKKITEEQKISNKSMRKGLKKIQKRIKKEIKKIKEKIKKPKIKNKQENEKIKEIIKKNRYPTKTIEKTQKQINEILIKSETEGLGIGQVKELIQKRFKNLKGYEAERIATTAINRANNQAEYINLMQTEIVEYIKWITCEDKRVRKTHRKMNGQIIRKGTLFSNGLEYPGDPKGTASEVINCRCTIIPYIMDWDKIPPLKQTYFYEKDLKKLPAERKERKKIRKKEEEKIKRIKKIKEKKKKIKKEEQEKIKKFKNSKILKKEEYRIIKEDTGYVGINCPEEIDDESKTNPLLKKIEKFYKITEKNKKHQKYGEAVKMVTIDSKWMNQLIIKGKSKISDEDKLWKYINILNDNKDSLEIPYELWKGDTYRHFTERFKTIGATDSFKGRMSTSLSKPVAKDFMPSSDDKEGKVLLRILAPSDTKANIFLGKSEYPYEFEFLLEENQEYQVIKKETKNKLDIVTIKLINKDEDKLTQEQIRKMKK